MITADRLWFLIRYEPETGRFFWRFRRQGVPDTSKEAGRINGDGYREICVDGRLYHASRLAWLYMTGQWPEADIDHRNRHRSTNRWSNLREATRAQNLANTGLKKSNTSGFRGVSADRRHGGWNAFIRLNGRRQWLGNFPTADAAGAAYQAEFTKAHGEFAQ